MTRGTTLYHQYGDGKPVIVIRVHPDAGIEDMRNAFISFCQAIGYPEEIIEASLGERTL